MRTVNRAAKTTGTDIDPVVWPPTRIIDTSFKINIAEAGVQQFTHLSFSVTIPVGKEHNIGSTNNNDTVTVRHNPITRRQVVSPQVCLVHPTIAVGVV